MKILALEAENVKHLKVVNIKPDGSLVVVGGDNAQGKTCVLDSIEYALNGAGGIPSKPIREGQKKARVVLDLGDISVTRTFTAKGTALTVKNKDGATFASPQSMLDKLVGELTFDPLEFSKMDAKQQSEVLKKLVGLDFDKANAKHKQLFEQRTVVNRNGKELKARLDNMTKHEGVPDTEVSVAELSNDYALAMEHNSKLDLAKKAIADETKELELLTARVQSLKDSINAKKAAIKGRKLVDTKALSDKMTAAGDTNKRVQENRLYEEVSKQVQGLRENSKSLSDKMAKIVDAKANALAQAKFPIKGLAIDDDGVTFEGIPFVQCSAAQRIRISVAIGLAMNPKLKVLLIREGSLLDNKNLKMVAQMAEKADAQIWMERVSKGKECQVIIEDGSVKQ
jgi:hypothetical protein